MYLLYDKIQYILQMFYSVPLVPVWSAKCKSCSLWWLWAGPHICNKILIIIILFTDMKVLHRLIRAQFIFLHTNHSTLSLPEHQKILFWPRPLCASYTIQTMIHTWRGRGVFIFIEINVKKTVKPTAPQSVQHSTVHRTAGVILGNNHL